MILAFDTFYSVGTARTVCLSFGHWKAESHSHIFTEKLEGIAEYVPGEFYRRELPCILSLLKKIPAENREAIIVDGFVYLDEDKKPGLDAHLYERLNREVPVIGVAKTSYAGTGSIVKEVYRGESRRPLFVTAAGAHLTDAAENIRSMHGANRIPVLLKQLDQLTRSA
jgi:deoxyribonuclease V